MLEVLVNIFLIVIGYDLLFMFSSIVSSYQLKIMDDRQLSFISHVQIIPLRELTHAKINASAS